MAEELEKKKRYRRTKAAIERDVMQAVDSLIEEVGYRNLTLTAVANKAKIEPAVFYRRFANLEELFDVYTRKYDYWLGTILASIPTDLKEEESLHWILQTLIQSLHKNKGMQQLLIWELSDDNPTTRRTAQLRESINEPLIRLLEQKFKGSSLDINVISAVIISGIYYLILHRKRSHFCDVDYNSRAGKDRFKEGVRQLTNLLFEKLKEEERIESIKNKLRAEGVSEEIIAKCF